MAVNVTHLATEADFGTVLEPVRFTVFGRLHAGHQEPFVDGVK